LFPADRQLPNFAAGFGVQVRLKEMELHRPRQWGACWLACHLYEQLELDEFWAEYVPDSREGTSWQYILQTLVCYRLIDPGSEWRLHRQWFDQSAMGDLLNEDYSLVEKNSLYRCLDKVLQHKEQLFGHLCQRWQDLFGARFEVLLYDLTSTYFESDPVFEEADKRQFRYSRDKRADCEVVIGLIITPEGFPLAYEVLPHLLSLLAYELLGGPRRKVETAGRYTPIAVLTAEGNAVLRRGLFDELSSSVELAQQFAASVTMSSPAASPVSEVRTITAPRLTQAVPEESKAFAETTHKSAVPALLLILGIVAAATVGIGGYFVYQRLRPLAVVQVERTRPSSEELRPSNAKPTLLPKSIVSPPTTPTRVPTLTSGEIPNPTAAVTRADIPQPTAASRESATSRAVRVLTGHSGPVRAVAVTRDGGRAVSASEDRTLRVWDLQTGQSVRVLKGHTGAVTDVAVTLRSLSALF
jgi:hypothetical protein